MKKHFRLSQGLKIETLPVPSGIKSDLQGDSWHRLSVAFGLSYPPFDIGKYTVPSKIEDIDPEVEPWPEVGIYDE